MFIKKDDFSLIPDLFERQSQQTRSKYSSNSNSMKSFDVETINQPNFLNHTKRKNKTFTNSDSSALETPVLKSRTLSPQILNSLKPPNFSGLQKMNTFVKKSSAPATMTTKSKPQKKLSPSPLETPILKHRNISPDIKKNLIQQHKFLKLPQLQKKSSAPAILNRLFNNKSKSISDLL